MPVSLCIISVVNISAEKQTFILAVSRNNLAERFGLFHGGFHHFRPLNTLSVVGKPANIRCDLLHVRKACSLFALCHGAEGIDLHGGISFYNVKLNIEIFPAIGSGI